MNLNLDSKLYFGGMLRCVAVLQAFSAFYVVLLHHLSIRNAPRRKINCAKNTNHHV